MRLYFKARILPAFGRIPLDRIGPEDGAMWFDAASRNKPGAANRTFEVLRAMMCRAEEWGLRERGSRKHHRQSDECPQRTDAFPRNSQGHRRF